MKRPTVCRVSRACDRQDRPGRGLQCQLSSDACRRTAKSRGVGDDDLDLRESASPPSTHAHHDLQARVADGVEDEAAGCGADGLRGREKDEAEHC